MGFREGVKASDCDLNVRRLVLTVFVCHGRRYLACVLCRDILAILVLELRVFRRVRLSALIREFSFLDGEWLSILVQILLLLRLHWEWCAALVVVLRLAGDQICVWWHLHLQLLGKVHIYSEVG